MLLVLVQEVVEDLSVQQCDALKIVARPGLKTDDLIDESV